MERGKTTRLRKWQVQRLRVKQVLFENERKKRTGGEKSIKNIVCVNLGICCVYLKHNHLVRPSICQNYPREAHKKEASEGTWHLKKAQSIKTQHAAVSKFGNSKRSLQSPECSGVFVFMHMQMCV